MLKETALVAYHKELGAKLVDFGGWNMPLNYGSQIEEHHAVRQHAGWFDVSHMCVVDLSGPDAEAYLRKLLANDVARLKTPGKALYSAMLNEAGGVIDDLIVYRLGELFRLVVNCATRDKDLAWMNTQASGFDIVMQERDDLAMIAVQGPEAREQLHRCIDNDAPGDLSVFSGADFDGLGTQLFVARTGYTGEDGYEVLVPNAQAEALARALTDAGVKPCGLAARDTLRLEAGMNLYGHEMDDTVSPLQANMGWTIAWEPEARAFIGRDVIAQEKADGVARKLVGLILNGKGVLRAGQTVHQGGSDETGIITSGTFSPSLGLSIALARVPASFSGDCQVMIRQRALDASIVRPVFVRHGEKQI